VTELYFTWFYFYLFIFFFSDWYIRFGNENRRQRRFCWYSSKELAKYV